MRVGTKSLLIGAHWPPHIAMVCLVWRWLYGSWPTWRETIAICLHDIGYWGCLEMDGPDGELHPELGAAIANVVLGREYGALILGHSKGYAEKAGCPLSKLYAPDKLSHVFEHARLYALRTRLTGELDQYRARTRNNMARKDDDTVSDEKWFRVVRMRMARGALTNTIDRVASNGLGADRGR